MACAAKAQLEHYFPGATVVTDTATDHWQRKLRSLTSKLRLPELPYAAAWHISKLFKREQSDYKCALILDGSGFAYGDQWGARKLWQRLSTPSKLWEKHGTPVIALPQAWGPFNGSDQAMFKRELSLLQQNAALIYVRDQKSMGYWQELFGAPEDKALPCATSPNVILSPDFTNLLEVDTTSVQAPGNVAVIPNSKMVEMNAVEGTDSYLNELLDAILLTRNAGDTPFLLNHEGNADKKLIARVNEALEKQGSSAVPVFESPDPIAIKAAIGQCRYIVSARFHGLVSALSQAVPVFAHGWSHKYQELLDDYGASDRLFAVGGGLITALKHWQQADETLHKAEREHLKRAADQQKERVKAMWEQIFEVCANAGFSVDTSNATERTEQKQLELKGDEKSNDASGAQR